MYIYEQIRADTLYIILYTFVTVMAVIASCYLLFRRSNAFAFALDITPPVRLRRWAAAFFAAVALSHVVCMPIAFLSSNEDIIMCDLVGTLVDRLTVFPLAIVVLLCMLQDRRRPLWPVAVVVAPFVMGSAWCLATRSYDFLPMENVYSFGDVRGHRYIYGVCVETIWALAAR